MQTRSIVLPSVIAAAGCAAAILYKRKRATRELRDQVVLITGGSRGLGLALAMEFARQGCRIAICARDAEELKKAEEKLSGVATEAAAFNCDVTDRASVTKLVQDVTARFGHIDILINNAGEIKVAPLESLDRADFESAMATMFWGPLDLTLAVLPQMRRQGSGHIVNIASVGGRVAIPRLLPYCCAKFALVAFSESLAAEVEREHIRVLTVSPGLMRSGSYLQAQFKGDAAKEFTWFGLAANLPGLTVAADYAAREVRRAVEAGRYTLTISWPAKLLVQMQAAMPEVTRHLLAGVNEYVLPHPGSSRNERSGKTLDDSFSGLFRILTMLGIKAARELNQTPAASG